MSPRDARKAQDLGPERLKPAEGTPILDRSVEADGPATDLCTNEQQRSVGWIGCDETQQREVIRARLLAWLAEGVREVTWALCSVPRERWVAAPPAQLDQWPALRHVRHLALRETHHTLPMVRRAVGESTSPESPTLSSLELEQAEAIWDPAAAAESADAFVRGLGEARYELLQLLETAPDDSELDWLLLSARQHELQHLAAIWRIALNWDRVARSAIPGVPLHPADRLEESH